MKQKLIRWSQRYVTELRKHLKTGPRGSLRPALTLGRQAAALGWEMLDLARIHERAMASWPLSKIKDGLIERAEIFFTEAITPMVETHRAARERKIELDRLKRALGRRTTELAAANRRLQRSITRRKSTETALKKSGEHYAKILKESRQRQEGLRQLTRKLLAAQENERKKISHELQNEIAQTLLGIQVRLLSLKQEARYNAKGFKNEIASTQRLVIKSAMSVRRVAREFGGL